jgi:DNA-binding HxlR family transcriptional regulator
MNPSHPRRQASRPVPRAASPNEEEARYAAAVARRTDSVGVAMAQIGDRWTFLVLREVFYGVHRFSDMARNLGIARNLLSQRLQSLVANGILERHQYSDRPTRSEYRLTDKGLDLYRVVVALMSWGDRWITGRRSLRLTHRLDGGEIEEEPRCCKCQQALTARDIEFTTEALHDSDEGEGSNYRDGGVAGI